MIRRARCQWYWLLLVVISIAADARAEVNDGIDYIVQPGDTLYLIATRYYNAPSASSAIYNQNKIVLDKANNDAPNQSRIYPGTKLKLPLRITSRGIVYERRKTPMDIELAKRFASANGIGLSDLLHFAQEQMVQRSILPSKDAPPPSGKYQPVFSVKKARRENVPDWFRNPDSDLERCGVAVCKKLEQLCYFECLSVAKRLADGDQQWVCEKIQKNPRDETVSIPYEINEETRGSCAELVQ